MNDAICVWLLCREANGVPDGPSWQLLEAAERIQAPAGTTFVPVFLEEPAARLPAGMEHCLALRSGPVACSQARRLADAVRQERPQIILAPATVWGRTLTAITAGLLETGLAADCTGLSIRGDGLLLQTRPAFGGRLLAEILTREARPQMATVRVGGAWQTHDLVPACPRFLMTAQAPPADVVLLAREAADSGGVSLAASRIVVAGGLGVGSREHFQLLRRLARRMGAAVGASRSAVNAGFAPYACQVGQSGHTVQPELYLAIGISGAVQHLAGMKNARRIIAVNSDPGAPIFDNADVGVVSDWRPYVEALLAELERQGFENGKNHQPLVGGQS